MYNFKSVDTKNHYDKELPKGQGLIFLFKSKNFRNLWIGQFFSQVADKFYIVLMVYLIAEFWIKSNDQSLLLTDGITSIFPIEFETNSQKITILATGIYIVNTIPAILIGTIAGIASDRWSKKKIMIRCNTKKALLTLFLPFCVMKSSYFIGINSGYWGAIIITFFFSVCTQFFAPSEQATIPLLVHKENLVAANSIYQTTAMVAIILGFAIGEPILTILKKSFLFFGINGGEFLLLPACYFIANLAISSIHFKEEKRHQFHTNLFKELNEGLILIRKTPTVRWAIIKLVILYSVLAALYVITIFLASSIESLGPTKFGSLLALCGLGIGFGAILLSQLGHLFTLKKMISIGSVLIICSLIFIGIFQNSLSIILTACFLLGLGAALIAIPAQTTIQRDTPERERGKVFGLQNNLINISLTLPLVLASTLVNIIGLRPFLWGLAAILLLTTVLEKP